MDDLDNGDRVFELPRDDLEGVCLGGGMFSWSLMSSETTDEGDEGIWNGASAAGVDADLRVGRESGVSRLVVKVVSARMSKPISWILVVAPFSCSLDEIGGEGASCVDGPGEWVGVVAKSRRLLGLLGLEAGGTARVAPVIPKLR
jgi:hypothetical protein